MKIAKIRIIYDRKSCIGAGACAAMDPKRFEMANDGKANLIGGKNTDKEVWELDANDEEAIHDAAESCPVDAIKLQKLIPDKNGFQQIQQDL